MKKRIAWATALLGLMLSVAAGAAAQDHAHAYGRWTPAEDGSGHTAVCETCGEQAEASCANYTMRVGSESRLGICAICGACKLGAFEALEGAEATPTDEEPKAQKGRFVACGKALPFAGEDERILYAFTIGYEQDGKAVTFKNRSVIRIPIQAELPEGFRLVRIKAASGDDSTQTAEEWIDVDYTFEDGVLRFESKNPALHIVVAGEIP